MVDRSEIERCYEIARAARAVGIDPTNDVDILLAPDLAARVEGIVGPPGVAVAIRDIKEGRTQTAFKIAKMILEGKFGDGSPEQLIAQAVRTGTAILTEGVLVAPTEGIAGFEIRNNPDGSKYLAVLYAGPIRSAGGTAAALSVLLADFARKHFGIGEWRPTDTVIERYVEEINLYDMRAARLQYKPSEEDLKHIVSHCPVCVDGEPTEELEVSVHRNVPGVATNRIRGGIALVLCEGIAQKAASVQSNAKKVGLNWDWLEKIIKIPKAKEKSKLVINDRFLDEVVAGRPIFAHPSAKYGFRLRYGRTRMTGIMAKAIHPATMIVLDGFAAIGTQLRIERPGKSCVLSPCSVIEGPVVKLDDGSVLKLDRTDDAIKVKDRITRILWLGDMLVTYGDFLKTNTPLHPAGYCEEWWLQEYEEALAKNPNVHARARDTPLDPFKVNAHEAFNISEKFGIPLHPRWTYFWDSINGKDIKQLIRWLRKANVKYEWFTLSEVRITYDPAKEILERILLPHVVEKDTIVIDGQHAFALFRSLGIHGHTDERYVNELIAKINDEENGLDVISKISGVKVMDKGGTWIGCRMGRPEKSRERLMKPAPHVLFPIGNVGGKTRNIMRAYKKIKSKEIEGGVNVEIVRMKCTQCGNITFLMKCEKCGGQTAPERICRKCGRISATEIHECTPGGAHTTIADKRNIDIVPHLENAIERCHFMPDDLKGVIGMTSDNKIPEVLEKGVLRAKHHIYVFKDGTCRFDATNMPLTHFYPKEIGTPVEKLKQLGYTKDAYGNELKSDDQLVELHPQDIIVSERCLEYMLRVAQFVDDELVCVYGQKPFYNANKPQDMIGHLVIHLSPHTSAGITSRIIGTTKARVLYAHPYNFCASRRNCDGDENAIMLMLDALINFSKAFLPKSRGGTMDAPLVLMPHIDPSEVDNEVHAMEVVKCYPLALYTAAQSFTSPSDVVLEKVSDRLNKANVDKELFFTHEASSIHDGVTVTRYITLKSMKDKIEAQLNLATKIAAVDERNAAERVILSHFLPDIYGNLHSFVRQQFRCVDCNAKYRRVPLIGKCLKCGGKLLLTINRGGVEKYLKISQEVADKYNLPHYLKQRLTLLQRDILSIFEDEMTKQFNLAEFM
jgi:DNA polymerase II large subunit